MWKQRLLWLLFFLAACSNPMAICAPATESILDDGSLAVLHEYQRQNPGASCTPTIIHTSLSGDGLSWRGVTYECTVERCTGGAEQ